MILNDNQITEQAAAGMISPFESTLVRITEDKTNALSYGLSSFGYDLRPAEAGWSGHLTLEFSNSSAADCRIYADEGIVQMLFFQGQPCATSYEKRTGKYQDQEQRITLPKI